MQTLKLALDWTPNTNHIGFFIAQALGYYEAQGINVEILNPAADNYTLTPGKKLALDLADFAIAPFETVISLNNKPNKVNAVAVYAILQQDLSCIACLASANIHTPKMLDGKIYASYKARYEDHIVQQMIRQDGGAGTVQLIYPDKLGIWETLLTGKADATWIFDNWEGIAAAKQSIDLQKFMLHDYQIPYGYSPVVLAKKEKLASHETVYKQFIQATKQGFLYVQANPEKAYEILAPHVPQQDLENIDLAASIHMTMPHFGQADSCGSMEANRVEAFLHWLVQHGLEGAQILQQSLFTNELLQ